MKKLVSFTMSLLFVVLIYGQGDGLTKWEVGGEFGGNISWMTGKWWGDDETKNKPIFTPVIGAVGTYNFTSLIGLTMGFTMMKAGVVFHSLYEDDEDFTERWRFTTLRLNPMVRFIWGTQFQYYAMAGFYVSKILCGKYVFNSQYYNDQTGKIKFGEEPDGYTGDDWYLSKELYRRIDIGLNIGGGVRYSLGPGLLYFNMLFGMGFCDFYKWKDEQWNGQNQPDGYKKFLHRNLAFTVGYVILLGSSL